MDRNNENKTNYSSGTNLTEKMFELYEKENKNNNQPYKSNIVYKQRPSHRHLPYFCSKCGKSFKIKKNLEEHLLEQKTPCNIVYDDHFIFNKSMQDLANSYNHLICIYYNPDIPFSAREKVQQNTLHCAQFSFKLAKSTNQPLDVLKCIKRLELNTFSGNFDNDSIDDITI